jgi:prepilin-type N-terminal cleavage/methylation domain-containing protein
MELEGVTMNTRRLTIRAFTLIELLVVIAIIMILAGILVPGINKAIIMGHAAASRSAIRELSSGAHAYESDYGYFPGQKRGSSMPTGSLALGKCLWGNPGTAALNKYLPFKEEKVMAKTGDNSRVPSDRFPDAMPMLYYPSKMCGAGSSVGDFFIVGDNTSLPGADSPNLSSYASAAKNTALGKPYHYDTFLIIGAGIDREYFTEDDLTNWR